MNDKIVDIIIPAYNAHKTIVDNILSICYQSFADKVKITIVNDASDRDYSDIVNKFKKLIDIKQLNMKTNEGPGFARQYGLDNTDAPYVMFMDSDDVLANPYAIEDLLMSMDVDTDIVISSFVKEDLKYSCVEYNSVVWLHGKLFRRSFIEDNGIRFITSRVNEDTAFNQLCILKKANIKYIDNTTYIWKYNENSITTKNDKEYNYKCVIGFAEAMASTLDMCYMTDCNIDWFKQLSCDILLSVYYDYLYHYSKYAIEDKKKIFDSCKRIHKYKKKFQYDDEYIDNRFKDYFEIYSNKYNSSYILNPKFTFKEFINMVEGDIYD